MVEWKTEEDAALAADEDPEKGAVEWETDGRTGCAEQSRARALVGTETGRDGWKENQKSGGIT